MHVYQLLKNTLVSWNRLKCPYCEINLDELSMADGLKHVLEHKKETQK